MESTLTTCLEGRFLHRGALLKDFGVLQDYTGLFEELPLSTHQSPLKHQ